MVADRQAVVDVIPRTLDQFFDAARRHNLSADRLDYGVAIACPVCLNGQEVILDDKLGIVLGICNHCGSTSVRIAWALSDLEKAASNGNGSSPSPSPSRVRPGGGSTESVPSVPSLKGTDGPDSPSHESVPEASSWLPVDLSARTTNPPAPPDLAGLFYLGKYHLLSGESEAMKTWLALAAAVDELNAGHGVYWVDGDDVGLDDVLERLRLLGATKDQIGRLFAYASPDEALDATSCARIVDRVRALDCRLVVLDGFNPLLVLHRLDPENGTDVEKFYRLVDPLRKLPTAVLLPDNVVKHKESRGKFSIGSERKHSKADVHLGMVTLAPLARGKTGKARINVHKDRPGHLSRPSPGIFEITSTDDSCTWRIRFEESHGAGGDFRPTALMERVSRYLEVQAEPPTRTQINDHVSGKGEYVRVAIDRLIEEGYATEFDGPNRSRPVRLERAFREDEDGER
jgi:hypothetical protein